MSPELALKLASIFEGYFTIDEFREWVIMFDVKLETLDDVNSKWTSITLDLVTNLEHGNSQRLLDSLLNFADAKNTDGIAHTSWERQDFHRKMAPIIQEAQELLETSAAPSEITVPAGKIFSAKSKVRDLLDTATGEVFIVAPYIGVGNLDCLRSLTVPIRLLTGTHRNSVEPAFDRAIAAFAAEGYQLLVRRAQNLHDRHLIFNNRCWLGGGSLKDAGKKPFHCVEIADKVAVIADLETKWQAGTSYP